MMGTHATEKGFTLLELTIILIVIGLIATPFIQEYRMYAQNVALSDTNSRFYKVESALQDFYEKNGYLPCPAETFEPRVSDGAGGFVSVNETINIYDDNENFGRQNCAAFVEELNDDRRTVLIGSVPVKTLNLSLKQAIDGWNNKIAYVVSKHMLSIPAYDADVADIQADDPTLLYDEEAALAPLADDLNIIIDFFARAGGPVTCDNRPISGIHERFIMAPTNQEPSDLIETGAVNTEITVTNPDVVEMISQDLCLDGDGDGRYDTINPSDLSSYESALEEANHALLISYGPTGKGAYSAPGALVDECAYGDEHDGINCFRFGITGGSTAEYEDYSTFYTNAYDYDKSNSSGVNFYDDIVYSVRADTFKMYTKARPDDPASNDTYSPYQVIGIGTDNPMANLRTGSGDKMAGIDVGGDILVQSGGAGAGRAMAANVCDGEHPEDESCFTPSIISGSGIGCDAVNSAVSGISHNNADCFGYTPFAAGEDCDTLNTGEFMVGVNADGSIICEVPPTP